MATINCDCVQEEDPQPAVGRGSGSGRGCSSVNMLHVPEGELVLNFCRTVGALMAASTDRKCLPFMFELHLKYTEICSLQ